MSAAELACLRWRCRRGTRELDALLGSWLVQCYAASDAVTRAAFADLLDEQDPDLWDWLVGRGLPEDPRFAMIVNAIRSCHRI